MGKRSRSLTIAFSLSAALLAFPNSALAVADGPDFFRVIGVAADDVLNIRADAGADSQIVGTIPPDGRGIRNLGCEGGLSIDEWMNASEPERREGDKSRWCRIEFRGIAGWAAGRFLGEDSAYDLTEVWYVSGLPVNDTLNIRSGPSTNFSVVGELDEGDAVRVLNCTLAATSTWCQILPETGAAASGWVNKTYLRQ